MYSEFIEHELKDSIGALMDKDNLEDSMNPNIVFSIEQLFEKIWGYDYAGDSTAVMVHINRIREKIEDDSKNPRILETVWGAGYRLNK